MKRRLQNPTQALVADFQSGRISRRQFLQTLAMLSGGVALAACAPAAPDAPSAASSAGGITPQVMIYGGSQDIASIDPSDRTDYSINAVMRQMYDRLFRFEGGWPQPIEPGLAQDWSASEDAREWTFQITDQAKDGSPLTAEDVAFSYETFLTKGLTDFRTVFAEQVQGVGVLGPHRVKFTFKPGVPTRDLPATVGGLPILSKADYVRNNRDMEASSLEPFLGSGPYVLERMETGKTLVYRRNPDYWGQDLPINRGQNNFDTIRIEYYADYNAAFEGFKAGTYTFRNEASSISWATGYDFPAVQNGQVIKVALPSGAKASGQAFLFNLRRPQFQDPRVREAIGLMRPQSSAGSGFRPCATRSPMPAAQRRRSTRTRTIPGSRRSAGRQPARRSCSLPRGRTWGGTRSRRTRSGTGC